jgi:probable rRNA maturation factor
VAEGKRRQTARHSRLPSAGRRQIDCCNRQKVLPVRVTDLKRLMAAALDAVGSETAEISLVIVDDEEIARLHEVWLCVPGPTDVITFDLGPPADLARPAKSTDLALHLTGEIVASGETARREAERYHWQPEHELAYYLVHGLLHLCGYDDHSPAERRAMRRRERQVMEDIGLPPPPRRLPRRHHAASSPSR